MKKINDVPNLIRKIFLLLFILEVLAITFAIFLTFIATISFAWLRFVCSVAVAIATLYIIAVVLSFWDDYSGR